MGATDAERARRSRRHRKGDHSLCDPSRCDGVTEAVTEPVTRPRGGGVSGLGPRGRRLWKEMAGGSLDAARKVLLEEACRIVDRLDKLDQVLAGEVYTWLRLYEDVESGEITLVIDKALSEARQQAVALKQLVAELRQGAEAGRPATGGGVLDEIAARRAQRVADSAGR